MARALDVLQRKEDDVLKFLAAATHAGGANLDFKLAQYVYKREVMIQAAFWEPKPLEFTGPGADHQPLTEASYGKLPTNTPPLPPIATARELVQCVRCGGCWPGKFCACVTPFPVSPQGTSCLISTSRKILRGRKKEEKAAAEKAVTEEEFQGEWMAPTPEFIATQPEVTDGSEGVRVPSVLIQQIPTEDWSPRPAAEGWSAAPTAQATEW
ncbi:40s ribosomal protein sa, partial [Lynx pardinus]